MDTLNELSRTLDQTISVGNAANEAMRKAQIALDGQRVVIDQYRERRAEHERLIGKLYGLKYQALLLAVMNEEKATYCTKEQAGLRTFLEMNAKLLRRLAE